MARATALAPVGRGRRAVGDGDRLLRDPLLRVRRVPGADAARPRVLGGAADGGVLALTARRGGGGDRGRPASGPPRPARADDDRIDRGCAARARVVARGEPDRVLRGVGGARRRDGHGALRGRFHGAGQGVPRAGRAAAGDDRDDARRGARQLHLPAARTGTDRRARLARRARRAGRNPRRDDRAAPRARAARPAGRGARTRRPPVRRARRCGRGPSGCSRSRSSSPRSRRSR